MSTILVPLDLEEGHTLPLFSLLKLLKAREHRVCCIGAPDVQHQHLVRGEGIEFIPIRIPQKALSNANLWEPGEKGWFFWLLLLGVLDEAITQLKPDLVMVRSQYYTEGLVIHYRYQLPIVFYISSFRTENRVEYCESKIIDTLMNSKIGVPELLDLLIQAGAQFNNFEDIAHLALRFPELILFPEAFDFSGRIAEPGVYYIGAGVDLTRKEEPFNWSNIDPARTLIYCGLGSQNHLQAASSRRFFQIVLDVAMEHPEWQFIIAIGKRVDPGELATAPTNVILTSWVPQLEVLRRANIMINHGGFGTIKECILMGVPMVVFPLMQGRDHTACAERVVYHGLGLQGDIEKVSSSELGSLIEYVTKNQAFRERVSQMREKFKQQDRMGVGIKVIEDVIAAYANRHRQNLT
jgi:MGT family glycosyltransferase